MKYLIIFGLFCGLFLVAVVGAAATLCRWKRAEQWAAERLTDSDGQGEDN